METEAEQELLDRLASPEGNLSDVTEALQAAREGTYDAQQKMLARWYAEQVDWNQKLDRLMDAVFTVERKNLLERQWRGLCMEPFWREVLPDWSSLQPVRMHISCSMVCV